MKLNTDRQAAAQDAARRANMHMGDAFVILENAARVTGNNEFMAITYELYKLQQRVQAIADQTT